MRIRPEIASTTDPTISPSCATWLSTSCERTTPSLPCVESSSSQAGMTHIWPSLSLNFEMRLPCALDSAARADPEHQRGPAQSAADQRSEMSIASLVAKEDCPSWMANHETVPGS